MLGKTAGGLFWLFRFLERAENTARLVETGWRIALTRQNAAAAEWESVLNTAGLRTAYLENHDDFDGSAVINFLLRDKESPSSVRASINAARSNARMVRTALTSEVWEAVNECWMDINTLLKRPVSDRSLAETLAAIRFRSAVVRGALHGTMLRNDTFWFSRLGTFVERADNTARILDMKYYVLLPTAAFVGSSIDNTQWETILRSVSADRSYRWIKGDETNPRDIADFLILDRRLPRSLAFCYEKIEENLSRLSAEYGKEPQSLDLVRQHNARYHGRDIDMIFDEGLHEFLERSIARTGDLAQQIEADFGFYG
ncbi:MAG: alpha-E domain-containing protein [Paracoccaceae bacterium]